MIKKTEEHSLIGRPRGQGPAMAHRWMSRGAWLLFATLTVAAAAVGAVPEVEEESWSMPIACGSSFFLNIIYTHNIPKFMTPGTVPFEPTHVQLKRGSPTASEAWYLPNNTIVTYGGYRWEWEDAGLFFKCVRHYMQYGMSWVDTKTPHDTEGTAVVLPNGHGPYVEEDERWGAGGGYIEEAGETEQLECYEVWMVWADESGYHEEYLGFDLCFRNGNMT